MNEDNPTIDEKLSMDELDAASGGASGANLVEVVGTVVELLPNAMFNVALDDGQIIYCHISGKLRMNYIRIRVGDKVTVELNRDDPTRGRITWRSK